MQKNDKIEIFFRKLQFFDLCICFLHPFEWVDQMRGTEKVTPSALTHTEENFQVLYVNTPKSTQCFIYVDLGEPLRSDAMLSDDM